MFGALAARDSSSSAPRRAAVSVADAEEALFQPFAAAAPAAAAREAATAAAAARQDAPEAPGGRDVAEDAPEEVPSLNSSWRASLPSARGLSVREAYGKARRTHEAGAATRTEPSPRELLRATGFMDDDEEDGENVEDGEPEERPALLEDDEEAFGVDFGALLSSRRAADRERAAAQRMEDARADDAALKPEAAGRAARQPQQARRERKKRPADPDAAVTAKYGKPKRSRVSNRFGERSMHFKGAAK